MDIFGLSFEFLPQLETYLEPIAKRSGLTSKEAIVLMVLSDYKNISDLFNQSIFNCLKAKGLITDDLSLTGKGAIIAKSVITAKNKFAETVSL